MLLCTRLADACAGRYAEPWMVRLRQGSGRGVRLGSPARTEAGRRAPTQPQLVPLQAVGCLVGVEGSRAERRASAHARRAIQVGRVDRRLARRHLHPLGARACVQYGVQLLIAGALHPAAVRRAAGRVGAAVHLAARRLVHEDWPAPHCCQTSVRPTHWSSLSVEVPGARISCAREPVTFLPCLFTPSPWRPRGSRSSIWRPGCRGPPRGPPP